MSASDVTTRTTARQEAESTGRAVEALIDRLLAWDGSEVDQRLQEAQDAKEDLIRAILRVTPPIGRPKSHPSPYDLIEREEALVIKTRLKEIGRSLSRTTTHLSRVRERRIRAHAAADRARAESERWNNTLCQGV